VLVREERGAAQGHRGCVPPVLSGVPHRIRHVERALEAILSRKGVVAWDGARILDWSLSQRPV
jgi:hypothetical protein